MPCVSMAPCFSLTILKHFLDPDRVDTHLLDSIADKLPVTDPVGVATENLARIA